MAEHALTDPPEADRAALLDTLAEGFRRAAHATGTVERHYEIAGASVRLRFAGGALVPFLDPAIAHLAADATSPPDFTIDLFDSASTGTPSRSSRGVWSTCCGFAGGSTSTAGARSGTTTAGTSARRSTSARTS